MMKCHELSDVDSCFNRALELENMFVLLERDAAAPATIRFWVNERIRRGLSQREDPQIAEALRLADSMDCKSIRLVDRKARRDRIVARRGVS
jgi:hypothetical protein